MKNDPATEISQLIGKKCYSQGPASSFDNIQSFLLNQESLSGLQSVINHQSILQENRVKSNPYILYEPKKYVTIPCTTD